MTSRSRNEAQAMILIKFYHLSADAIVRCNGMIIGHRRKNRHLGHASRRPESNI